MRTVVIAIAIISLVAGAWLASRHTADTESVVNEAPPRTAVDAAPRENPPSPGVELPAENDSADADEVTVTLPKNWGPHGYMPTPYDEPEFRTALVGYLVESGLSATDSERSADAAIKGLDSCIFIWGYADEPALDTCTWTVLQQIGLSEASHRAVLKKSASEASRRKAAEAAAAAAERLDAREAARRRALEAAGAAAPR